MIPIEDNEVLCAEYNLKHEDQKPLIINEMTTGAAALFQRGYFPWGALPYPYEHAKLGSLLFSLGESEIATRMATWQRQTLDHYKRPIFSLLNQERSCTFEELEGAVLKFLTQAPCEPMEHFVDPELGMVRLIDDESTFLSIASGCKSGMGAHLFRDGGIINYGPQLLPLGDCSGFGLAGKPRHFSFKENVVRYQTRLAAPHPRRTGFPIDDSGYSGVWMTVEQSLQETACSFDGFRPIKQLAFSFFLKAPFVMISGSHKLVPRSLDRYLGPPTAVLLDGGLELMPLEGALSMEVIPLAGDESFWGADFLVAFTLGGPFRFATAITA